MNEKVKDSPHFAGLSFTFSVSSVIDGVSVWRLSDNREESDKQAALALGVVR
ncbi:hypothetical protein SDC9_132482 [bioreactor metagenome]|uniref:Uncharacterized protein n=1 Tax=bioreactor metagenome TaxID=1076179 RepID=A0A645D816_9ZZZZ